ncbi:MAG: TrkH family potassium uptake protein [Thiobacillaceae bacterium]|jgi:trk system potassium uptake protein TrkH|nr:TrkH family potassium uptake protein [Thiobacillaceae bacterium]
MARAGPLSLIHAVRWPVLACYLGQLALIVALMMAPPLAVAFAYGEHATGLRYVGVLSLLVAIGWPLARRPAPDQIQNNEAMVIVVLAFLITPLLMSWPLTAAGLSPLDALFEAVSAITTTGLTTLDAVADKPRGFLFARAWLQWCGGLGIAVLAVALLARHGLASRKLVESSGAEVQVSTTRAHARRVLLVYVLLTLAGTLLIRLAGLAPFDAVTHALAAVSTGGFSTFDRSLGGDLPTLVPYAVLSVSLLGAVSLPLYYLALRGGAGVLGRDAELRALIGFCLAGTLLLAVWFWQAGWAPLHALRHAGLLAVSAQTTAGFSSLEVAALDDFPKGLLILMMAAGGSVGSTAGGVKLLRVLILLRLAQTLLRRAAAPEHAVVEARLGGRRLEEEDITRALLVIVLFAAVVLLSWLAFLAHGHAPLDALFEVVSATGTVGLSAGLAGAHLPDFLKLVLCLDMLAGRLEIVALLVALYPRTWIGKRQEA